MAKKKKSSDAADKYLNDLIITGGKFKSPGNIPTGHFSLDFIIHNGVDPTKVDLSSLRGYDPSKPLGLPLGKVVELFGEEGGGKSSLGYRVVGYAQKLGYTAAWIDSECSFSEDLAIINGCDIEDIIYINTSNNNLCAEDVLDTIINMCENPKGVPRKDANDKKFHAPPPKVIVVDSLASLIPKAVDESDSEQQFMGLLARIFSQNMGKVAAAAERNGVLLVFINQLREKIGLQFGNPETSPGGRALKHHFSLRLKITRRKSKEAEIKEWDEDLGDEVTVGGRSYVTIEKNRFAKPYRDSIDIPIYYVPIFPEIVDIAFDAGRQFKLISVYKNVFNWENNKAEGKKRFIQMLKEKELVNPLIRALKEKAKADGLILPPELSAYEIPEEEKNDTKVPRSRKTKNSKGSKDNPK